MKLVRLLCRVILFGITVRALTAQSNPQQVLTHEPNVASAITLWQNWIESKIAYRGTPGMAVGIVVDQQLIWFHGFGYSDVAKQIPMTEDTQFRVASITKPFTSTAILQLRDAGKLRLNDPIEKYLPWFKLHSEVPGVQPITIWDLLTHTAGLPRESDFPYWTDDQFPTHEEMLHRLEQQDAIYAPETRWKYSDLGFALAGEIVTAVSGEPYEKYVQEHILYPLGMRSSGFSSTIQDAPRLAIGYGRRMPDGSRAQIPFIAAHAMDPAAGLTSSVKDLAQFVMLQFRGGTNEGANPVLAPASLRAMHRVQWLHADWSSGDSLGFSIQHTDSADIVSHGGTFKGYKTNISFVPEAKMGVIVLTNADDGDPSSYTKQFFQVVAPEIIKAMRSPRRDVAADPAWNKFVGHYRNSWSDTDVLVVDGSLVLVDPQSPDARHSYAQLVPAGVNTFTLSSDNGSLPIGESVVFELNANGAVSRLKVGSNYAYPIHSTNAK
jgi:D-alanyl-D-alanine carboxypeptidase